MDTCHVPDPFVQFHSSDKPLRQVESAKARPPWSRSPFMLSFITSLIKKRSCVSIAYIGALYRCGDHERLILRTRRHEAISQCLVFRSTNKDVLIYGHVHVLIQVLYLQKSLGRETILLKSTYRKARPSLSGIVTFLAELIRAFWEKKNSLASFCSGIHHTIRIFACNEIASTP